MSKKIELLAMSFIFIFIFSSFAFAAEPYPIKEIELIVPFGTGGGLDLMSRTLAPKLSEILGKPVIVINKPGASGTVGTALGVKSKPDGYTLITISPSCILFAPLFQKVPYDPVKDITYIAGWVDQPYGIQVRADAPWKTLPEVINYAKKNPGKIRYGSTGVNGIGHIYMESIAKDKGVNWINIPMEGDGKMIPALLGGHIEVATMAVAWAPHAKAGKMRPLALFGTKRFADFPNTPTLNELGFNYYAGAAGFLGVGAPAGLPEDIRKKLEDAFQTAVSSPEFKKTAEKLSLESWFRPGVELAKSAEEGLKSIDDMAKRLGLKKK
jgi:tripartite-type tricarboxylate transporter receptor subunit TctC